MFKMKLILVAILILLNIVVTSYGQPSSFASLPQSHQSQRLEIAKSANQTDKRRSIGLGDLSYSYAATDIGSPHGSHIKTITVIKNVKLPKHTGSGDKEYKPDEWVKHVDTQFKMVLKVPEFPEIPAFNYLPIDVGHKKPPVVATVAPPPMEPPPPTEPEKPKEEEMAEKPKEEKEPENKEGKMEGAAPEEGVSSETGGSKIDGDAENVVGGNEGNLEITDDAEQQSQRDRDHIFKMAHQTYNRQPHIYVESLPQAMSLVKTQEQADGSKVEQPLKSRLVKNQRNIDFPVVTHSFHTQEHARTKVVPTTGSLLNDQSDIEFIGNHAIRAQDAVRSKVAQAEWNRVRQPSPQRQETKNRPQSAKTKVKPIRNGEVGSGHTQKTATIIEDFSEYSMHNVKHIMDPVKAQKVSSNMRYKVDVSTTANPMPNPLSHQTQQTMHLKLFDADIVSSNVDDYANLQKPESEKISKRYENKKNKNHDKERIHDESSEWSAYSDSDKGAETQAFDAEKGNVPNKQRDSNTRRNQYFNSDAYTATLEQTGETPSYNLLDLQKLATFESQQSDHPYNNDQYNDQSDFEKNPKIEYSQSNIRSSDEFVSYEATKQGYIPESPQLRNKLKNEYSQNTDHSEQFKGKEDILNDQADFGEYQFTKSDQRNQSVRMPAYSDPLNSYKAAQQQNNQKDDNKRDGESKGTNEKLLNPRKNNESNQRQAKQGKHSIKEPEAHSNNAAYKVSSTISKETQPSSDLSQYQTYHQPSYNPNIKPYSAPSIQKAYSTSSTTTQRMPYMAPIKSRAPMQFYIIHAQTTSTQKPYLSPSVYKSYSLNQEQAKLEQQKLDAERDLLEQQQQDEELTQLRQKQPVRSQPLRAEETEDPPRAEKLQKSHNQGFHSSDVSTRAPHFDKLRFFDSGGKSSQQHRIPQDVEVFSDLSPIKSQSYRSATHDELRVTSPRPRTSTPLSAEIQLHFPPQHVSKYSTSNGALPQKHRTRPEFVAVPLDISTASPFVRDPKLGKHKVPPHLVRHPLVFDSNPPHAFLESPFRLSRKP